MGTNYVLPKHWYIPVTEDNRDVLNKWRLERAYNYRNPDHAMVETESMLLSDDLHNDGSWYTTLQERELNSRNSEYKKITFEQFNNYVLKQKDDATAITVPDFKIKGTPLPFIPRGIEYRCKGWAITSTNSLKTENERDFVSFGSVFCRGERYIFAERKDYAGILHFMFKEVDIIKLYKKENQTPMKKITHEQAQSIIDIACSNWKTKLANKWAVEIVKKETIEVSEEEYKEMLAACTPSQRELFKTIFPESFLKEGTPCLVRDNESLSWILAYADGKGLFKSAKTSTSNRWNHVINLSIDLIPEY